MVKTNINEQGAGGGSKSENFGRTYFLNASSGNFSFDSIFCFYYACGYSDRIYDLFITYKKPLYVLSVNFVLSLHDISYNAIKNKKSSKKIILMF